MLQVQTPPRGREPVGHRPPSSRPGRCRYGEEVRHDASHGRGGGAADARVDLIARARAGDEDAFRELTEPHVRELQVHCYRMLGSFQDAEDALQDVAGGRLARPRRLRGPRVAAHLALHDRHPPLPQRAPLGRPAAGARVGRARRRTAGADAARRGRPGSSRCPTRWSPAGSTYRSGRRRATSRASRSRWRSSPPCRCCRRRQIAVLILRDVLGFTAKETAEMLDATVESVTSALKRARASLDRRRPSTATASAPPRAPLVGRGGAPAHEVRPRLRGGRPRRGGRAADRRRLHLDAADALRVPAAAPPSPTSAGGSSAPVVASTWSPTRANGQPAYGVYLRGRTARSQGVGLYVLTVAGDRISAMVRFEAPRAPVVRPAASLPRRGEPVEGPTTAQ